MEKQTNQNELLPGYYWAKCQSLNVELFEWVVVLYHNENDISMSGISTRFTAKDFAEISPIKIKRRNAL